MRIWQCVGKMRGRNDNAYMHVWYDRFLDKVCGLHGGTFAMDEMSVLLTKCIDKATMLLTMCMDVRQSAFRIWLKSEKVVLWTVLMTYK